MSGAPLPFLYPWQTLLIDRGTLPLILGNAHNPSPHGCPGRHCPVNREERKDEISLLSLNGSRSITNQNGDRPRERSNRPISLGKLSAEVEKTPGLPTLKPDKSQGASYGRRSRKRRKFGMSKVVMVSHGCSNKLQIPYDSLWSFP